MVRIGNIKLKNNVVMAPMAGISNPAYMKICEDMGVAYAVTELISAEAIVRVNKKTLDMLNGYDILKIPVFLQLFGSNADTLSKAAKYIEDNYNFSAIDINMGCPVPKVAISSHAGSALLKDPDKVYEIVKKTVEAVSIPVTVKIRSGWDKTSINAVEIAKKIESAGASLITIHGRTRSDGYSGKVDLDIIKKVKEAVNIPVIGNGDIKTVYDAKYMLDYTKCDAIMLARGILGNPWLIRDCINYLDNGTLPKEVTIKEKFDMIKKHMDLLLSIKSEKVALLEMRTNAAYYLKGIKGTKELKTKIFKTKTKEEIIKLLDDFLIDNKEM